MNDTITPINSIEVTKSELCLSLSKEGLAYQQLLQDSENVVFTRDNLLEERGALVNLRKVKKALEDAENPFTERWKNWNSARKSLVDPVAALLTKKEGEFRTVSREIEAEKQKEEAEKQRVAGIKQAIDTFFLEQSGAIAGAKSLDELTRIEKLIGSHKANTSRYAEFLPDLIQKASNLTPLIKEQKDALRKLQALKEAENAANAKGDDQAVLDSREAQERIEANIQEKRILVQEQGINMASNSVSEYAETVAPEAPKARRSVWKWELTDITRTMKAMPSWVLKMIDEEAVDVYLKTKKAEGIEQEEFFFAGIRFYLEKTY